MLIYDPRCLNFDNKSTTLMLKKHKTYLSRKKRKREERRIKKKEKKDKKIEKKRLKQIINEHNEKVIFKYFKI